MPGEVTILLQDFKQGREGAAGELVSHVYRELRRIAGACMRGERPGHTLQATALVNEAWLRLVNQADVDWRDRAHFFGVAAQTMRRVLVDYARARRAGKRGGGEEAVPVDGLEIEANPGKLDEVLAVDEALTKLAAQDEQQARVVEMHYFAGMTVKETAEALGMAVRTVEREWGMASAWLRREMSKQVRQ